MVRKSVTTRPSTVVLSGRPESGPDKTKLVGAGKRKSGKYTKKAIKRREVYERKQARAIKKEQDRATNNTAISRAGFKRVLRDVLQNNPICGEDGQLEPAKIASKAVTILQAVAEDEIVRLANQASFLLEFAGKSTLTPEVLETMRRMKMAQDRTPVFQLPPREAPAGADEDDGEEGQDS